MMRGTGTDRNRTVVLREEELRARKETVQARGVGEHRTLHEHHTDEGSHSHR